MCEQEDKNQAPFSSFARLWGIRESTLDSRQVSGSDPDRRMLDSSFERQADAKDTESDAGTPSSADQSAERNNFSTESSSNMYTT